MAGINFNDLPQNLQSKLQSFMAPGVTVENAIETAKKFGKWTEADTKQLNALNGGANWGKVMDEYAFDSSKAGEYKQLAANKASAKKFKDIKLGTSQEELDKKRADLKRSIVEKRSQGVMGYLSAMVDRVKLDMTPEKAGQQVAGGSARILIAAALAAVTVAMTSCENDVNVSQAQSVTIPRESYRNELNAMIALLQGIQDTNAAQYKAFLQRLDSIIANQNASKEELTFLLNGLYSDLEDWLQQIVDNQIEMKVDNNKNAQDILNALMKIINGNGSMESKLDAVIKLLQQIKTVGESIDTTTKDILEEIRNAKNEIKVTLNTNNQAVLAALEKLNENDQLTLNILNDIKALIAKYGTEGNSFAQAILVAIGQINPNIDLSGVEAMLKQLVNGQKQTNQEVSNLTNLFNKFSSATATQLNTIIAKLDKNSPSYEAQLNAIIKLLEQLDANNDARNQKILNAIEKLGANLSAQIATVIAKLDKNSPNYEAQLNTIIGLLDKLDKNNETRNKKVLDAIDKLGVKISGDLTAIFNKIGQGGTTAPDYTEILNKILDKIGAIQADNNNNFAKVIEAIGNIDIKPQDLSWIKAHLDAILEAIKDHDVIVKVEGGKCCCCDGNGTIHEGVLGDLNELLG